MERGREADGEVRIRMWGGQCERGGTGGEEDGLGMRWDGIGAEGWKRRVAPGREVGGGGRREAERMGEEERRKRKTLNTKTGMCYNNTLPEHIHPRALDLSS